MGKTNIQIDDATWRELHQRKNPGDSFDDVIQRLLEDDSSSGERAAEVKEKPEPRPEPEPQPSREQSVSARVREAVGDVADGWEDSDARLAARREAAERVLAHAVDTGDAVGKSSEIVDEVVAEVEVPGQNRETYYRKNIRPVLREYGTYDNGRHGYVVDSL